MTAVEFEADIVSEFLRIPNFEQLKNKHVRVVIEEEVPTSIAVNNDIDACFDRFHYNLSAHPFSRDEANER
jgi:hypothetical protein